MNRMSFSFGPELEFRLSARVSVLEDLAEEVLGPFGLRVGEELLGVFSSTIAPSAMKSTRSAAVRAKPISWVTTTIVICLARSTMTSGPP